MHGFLKDYHTAARWPAVDCDAGVCDDGSAGGIFRVFGAGVDGADSGAG